ncbi:hypothetical protein [Actinomadura fibrosa]|uniref:DUF3263 domain-containing protein n=1 Tax=Actinomadura fibrosa TaxID=111802 RepID=A0ABW2XIV2_9ACTN|nr:hypothetical protein [Actinomadura fibrosa]
MANGTLRPRRETLEEARERGKPDDISDRAWELYLGSLDPEIQALVRRAPKMTPEQAARLRRLWNGGG